MTRKPTCACGSTDHKYKNHPNCKFYNNQKKRVVPKSCPSCNKTDHLRSTSHKCKFNKVLD